jgi:hypothetical protein
VPKSGQKAGYNFGLPLNRDALLILRKLKTLNPTSERVFQYTPAHLTQTRPIDDFNTAAFQKACVRAELPEGVNWHSALLAPHLGVLGRAGRRGAAGLEGVRRLAQLRHGPQVRAPLPGSFGGGGQPRDTKRAYR